MPVLLRATGAGSRPSNTSRITGLLRPPSRGNESHRSTTARRTSHTPSTQTGDTVLNITQTGDTVLNSGVNRTQCISRQPQPSQTCIGTFRLLYKRYHIKYLFPLMFIMLYMVVGSVIFYLLESSSDQQNRDEEYGVYIRERELLRRRLDEIFHDHAAKRREVRLRFIDDAVDHFEKQLGLSVSNESQWSLMSAMYYSGTLFTTIGYGDIACVTVAGRILTVIYSCVGIPLMLITLNDCGKFLYNNINGLVKNVENFGTYLGVLHIGGKREPKRDEVDALERGDVHSNFEVSSVASEVGSLPSLSDIEEIEDSREKPRMSVKVALGITIGWIFFCSGLFRLWEDWTYAESCYFMYISLSTIGLGDLSVKRRDMMVLCFVFVIVGLSLVSMSINVVQVSLEDFYVNLMMKLIIEYQEKMAAGGDHMGASVGMMRMWSGNKTAKYLMPLLSKEKKRVAMDKVEREALVKGIEVPKILTELNEKTGMPEIFHLEKKIEGDQPPTELEHMVQRQIMQEEVNEIPTIPVQEAECQTCALEMSDKIEQTLIIMCEDGYCQTDEEKKNCIDVEAQTEHEERHSTEAQTINIETADAEVITTMSQLMDALCQTETIPMMDQISQTSQIELVNREVSTVLETKNIRIQTPCPSIVQKTIQTEDLEERKSPSKMSSAKKRLRRAFAKTKHSKAMVEGAPTMSEWKDVVEDEEVVDVEEEGSEESLHWDPVDGLHAEKQLPVSMLAEMFDQKVEPKKSKRKSLSSPRSKRKSVSRKSD